MGGLWSVLWHSCKCLSILPPMLLFPLPFAVRQDDDQVVTQLLLPHWTLEGPVSRQFSFDQLRWESSLHFSGCAQYSCKIELRRNLSGVAQGV